MMRPYPEGADGDALMRVAARGSDMEAPMLIEFFVSAVNETAARNCQERLSSRDFHSVVSPDDAEDDDVATWTVTIPVEMIPDHDEVVYFQEVLTEDLSQFGGTADGWETRGNAHAPEQGEPET